MSSTHEKQPFYLRKSLFAIFSLVLAGAFTFLARYLYRRAGKPTDDFVGKLGEYALEIAVFVLVGAAVKEVIDWLIEQRARRLREADKRADFLRRLRDVHVRVMYSRDLIVAHKSPKTWTEQSQDLMRRVPELEEISEDLKATPGLFRHQSKIEEGIGGMMSYLTQCRDEYVINHPKIVTSSDAETISKYHKAMNEGGLPWYAGFLAGGSTYTSDYVGNLTKSKGEMRQQVYGSKV